MDLDFMIQALIQQGVPVQIIRIIKELYTNLKSRIKTDKIGPFFDVKKAVKQGDPLSSLLFTSALEQIFRNLEWEGKGVKINGSYLNNPRFADDIVLIAKNVDELEEMLGSLQAKSEVAGLYMNMDKYEGNVKCSSRHQI